MKTKFTFYVLAAFFFVDFSFARNEIKRRQPIIDSTIQDSDGNYIDQLALDSVNYASANVVSAPENYQNRYHTATDEFRKSTPKAVKSEKIHYVTPEPYKNNFSQDYVHHALKTNEKAKEKFPASSFLDYSSVTNEEPKKSLRPKLKKNPSTEYEDYNYYFPESKKINTRKTQKPTATIKESDKYFQPQSPGALITKDTKVKGDDFVNTYHYYYPEESSTDVKFQQASLNKPTSTLAPPITTKFPKFKQFSSKKKSPSSHAQQTSTDSYQYPPVLQRPSEYTPTDYSHQEFYPTYDIKSYGSQSTATPSTLSPIKMLKPTKKNNYYLPSSTMSPSTTAGKPYKIRRPSTETPYDDVKQFSVSPSPSTLQRFSTTRAPEIYKYSSASPVSSTTLGSFYMKPSSQITPTASVSPVYLSSESNDDRTVVIRPKPQYTNNESYESYEPIKEKIVYKFVPEETYNYEPNKTENVIFHSTTAPFSDSIQVPDYYKTRNETTQADADFFNKFHKNYNYEYFTEQDAGPMSTDHTEELDFIDDKQKATKKNMMFEINPEMHEYHHQNLMPSNNDEHEMPPPMNVDNDAEASKNQYFVLYSIDEEEKKQKRMKKKQKESEVTYHHHHHQHEDKGEDFHQFDSEFDGEFDAELSNSDNVRIVDPAVRGGRPLEFTKDDYLRHIKQAVVQYMKDNQKDSSSSSSNSKSKNQRFQELNQEMPYRPTKTPTAMPSQSYKHNVPSQQYKPMHPLKLPKNVYSAGRLKDAIDDLQESPQVDLTLKKHKQKPFDLSAIDVGQTYQHVNQFDHSGALKNVEDFDQTNVVMNQHQNKPKLHFSQQTYHDINNLGYNQKQKQQHQYQQFQQQHQQQQQHHQSDDSDNEPTQNLYKGYMLPKKYSAKGNQNDYPNYSAMNYDSSKLPRIANQQGQNDDDDDDNKVDDPVDAPIQIINGIPVANPYNIDLNTLKYMLGGIAQAEVNDQLKDLDESPSNQHKFPANWKNFNANQFGQFTSNAPIYPVYGGGDQQENGQRQKKNSGGPSKNQQSKFPLLGSLSNYNKGKAQNNNNNNNKQKNFNSGNKNMQNFADFSNWNQMNKKQRNEPQASSSNSQFVLRPMLKNKHAHDERVPQMGPINRVRTPALSTDMRPPPPLKPKTRVIYKKVH